MKAFRGIVGGEWRRRMGSIFTFLSLGRNPQKLIYDIFPSYTQCNKTGTQCAYHVPEATSQRSLHPPTSVNPGPSKSLGIANRPHQPEGREKLRQKHFSVGCSRLPVEHLEHQHWLCSDEGIVRLKLEFSLEEDKREQWQRNCWAKNKVSDGWRNVIFYNRKYCSA